MKDIPIVSAATGFTSEKGRNYILVFHEALYMPDMRHTLINPNQCWHFGAKVQDNPYHENWPMSIESPDGEFAACLQSIGTVMFLDTWFPTNSDLESYPHIELTSRQHWNPHKIEFPQKKYSMQEEVEGRNVSKATIWFSGETPGYTDLLLDGDTIGDFRSYSKEVVVHAGMDDFHRRLVAGVAATATQALAILNVNRDKKCEILLAVGSKDSKYRSDRMAARIVEDIISK